MEKQIKSIISDKLNDINFKNNTDEKELKLLEKLYDIFPDLKNNKENAVNDINNTNDKNNTNNTNKTNRNIKEIHKSTEIVLDEIIINNEVFYKDKYGGIWNDKFELVGTVDKNNCKNENYILFSKNYNMDNNINNFI